MILKVCQLHTFHSWGQDLHLTWRLLVLAAHGFYFVRPPSCLTWIIFSTVSNVFSLTVSSPIPSFLRIINIRVCIIQGKKKCILSLCLLKLIPILFSSINIQLFERIYSSNFSLLVSYLLLTYFTQIYVHSSEQLWKKNLTFVPFKPISSPVSVIVINLLTKLVWRSQFNLVILSPRTFVWESLRFSHMVLSEVKITYFHYSAV